MNPITIDINVRFGLTAEVKGLLNDLAALRVSLFPEKEPDVPGKEKAEPVPEAPERPEPDRVESPKTEPETPVKEPEVPDMPEDIAAPVTDEELISAVAAAKKGGPESVNAIRELFKKYGIPNSTACPPEKRAALVFDLTTLSSHA